MFVAHPPVAPDAYDKAQEAAYIQSGLSAQFDEIKNGLNRYGKVQVNRFVTNEEQKAVMTILAVGRSVQSKSVSYTFHF
jgi:hypothetical protein